MPFVDDVITAYLAIHVLTVFFIDAQIVVPAALGTTAPWDALGLGTALSDWGNAVGDTLVLEKPRWFQAIVWGELILQLPFCVAGAAGWAFRQEWVKIPSVVYSVHVLTTMIPITACLYHDGASALCLAVYGVWIALPALMLWRAATIKSLFSMAGPSPSRAKQS